MEDMRIDLTEQINQFHKELKKVRVMSGANNLAFGRNTSPQNSVYGAAAANNVS